MRLMPASPCSLAHCRLLRRLPPAAADGPAEAC